jgi:hypothetical protein
VVKIVPKVGPASMLAIKIPDAQTETLYIKSVNQTAARYRELLEKLRENPQTTLDLPNRDLDTGAKVRPGAYKLTDETYAKLVARLTRDKTIVIPAEVKRDILDYYADPNAPITTKKNARAWKRLEAQLEILHGMRTESDRRATADSDGAIGIPEQPER